MRLDQTAFAVLDVETTGFVPGRHRIVEVAVVLLDPGHAPRVALDTVVCAPHVRDTFEIHRISPLLAARAPSFRQVAGSLLRCLAGRVIVGHNVGFDLRHVHAELDRLDVALPQPWATVDTMRLDAALYGQGRRTLGAACAAQGLDRARAHEAGVDAVDTARLFEALLEQLRDDGVARLQDLQRLTGAPLADPRALAPFSGLPESFSPVSRYAERLRSQQVLGEYAQLLSIALADTTLSEAEARALQAYRASHELAFTQVRALHAQAFAAAIVMFCQDGHIDAAEAAYLRRLRRALSEAGWCPGDEVRTDAA